MIAARGLPALFLVLSACSSRGAGPGGGGGAGSGGVAGTDGVAGGGGTAVMPDAGSDVSTPLLPERWLIDSVTSIHGLTPTVHGSPVVTSTPHGDALCFDGDDAVILDDHPLAGLGAFTLEVLVRIDGVTATALNQPRFLHIEAEGPARATIEARVTETTFYLDTFLLAGTSSRTLADGARLHPVGQWTWTALTYDGVTMRHYVDGVEDASGPVTVPAFGAGKLSLGVRQNLMYWFAGCIREVRVTPAALTHERLQRVNPA